MGDATRRLGTAKFGYGKFVDYGIYHEIQFYDTARTYNKWTSMSQDIPANSGGGVADSGFSGAEPTDRLASAGSLQFTLNNFNYDTETHYGARLEADGDFGFWASDSALTYWTNFSTTIVRTNVPGAGGLTAVKCTSATPWAGIGQTIAHLKPGATYQIAAYLNGLTTDCYLVVQDYAGHITRQFVHQAQGVEGPVYLNFVAVGDETFIEAVQSGTPGIFYVASIDLVEIVYPTGDSTGYYSPGHPNCRPGFDDGALFRLQTSDGFAQKYYLRSKVNSVSVTPGKHASRQVRVTCSDYFDDLTQNPMAQIPMQTTKRIDQAIATVLAAMSIQPKHTSFATGLETYSKTLFGLNDGRTNSITALQQLCQTDKSYLFLAGDTDEGETLTWQTRLTRTADITNGGLWPAGVVFNNNMFDLQVIRDTNRVMNHIITIAHPTKADAAAVILATLQHEITLANGTNPAFVMSFVDPSGAGRRADMVYGSQPGGWPVADTDYKASSIAGDGGNDKNGVVTFTVTWGSNSASVVPVVTGGATVYLNKLTIRGIGVYDYDPIQSINQDTTSKATFNNRPFTYDAPYADLSSFTNALGAALLIERKAAGNFLKSLSFYAHDPNNPTFASFGSHLDIGMCIQVNEDVSGVSGLYYIQGMRRELMADNKMKVTLTNLEPALTVKAFQICAPGDSPSDPTKSILALYPNGDGSYTDTDPYGNKFHVVFY
jgi:hypothetical protein